MKFSFYLLLCVAISPVFSQESGKARSWTNSAGKQVEAILLHADATTAHLKLANGKVVPVPLASLSGPDRNLIAEMLDAEMVLRPMPQTITAAGQSAKFAVNGNSDLGPDFEKRIGVILATSEGLPFGLKPSAGADGEKFQIHMVDSAGYSSSLRDSGLRPTAAFLQESGMLYLNYLAVRGDKLTPDKQAEIDHEVAALTLMRLRKALPAWLLDGLAANIASMPATGETVSPMKHEAGFLNFAYTRWGADVSNEGLVGTDPSKLFGVDAENWSPTKENRIGAFLLAYYFMHLDQSSAPGVTLVRALGGASEARVVSEEEKERLRVAYNSAIEDYNAEGKKFIEATTRYNEMVIQYNKQVALKVPEAERIKVGPKPVEPKKPEIPDVLKPGGATGDVDPAGIEKALLKGRTFEELSAQVKAAFDAKGIAVSFIR